MFDNGVKRYVQKEERFQVNPAGTISFGAENADFFYQNEPYITGNKMYYLDTQGLTENACLFLKSILQVTFTYQFSFSEGMIPARIKDEMISLPATLDGQPDWAYMDAYMSEVLKKEEVFAEHLASLTAEAVADGHKLDTSGWKAFRIGDLFEIRKGRRLTKAAQIEGDTAFIGATMFNNGVTAFIGNNEHVFPGHCLSVCYNGAVGVTFFQKDDFWASDDVNALYSKTAVSDLCLMFMAPLIEQVGKQNFAYVDKWTQELMAVSEIYLPVTFDGQPDWAWMEYYMQQQMDKAEALVKHLDAVWN